MYVYLYAYSTNIFNGSHPVFELEPIKSSDILRAVIFAGKGNISAGIPLGSVCYLYIESDRKIDAKNAYKNLRIYENLLCLVSGKPVESKRIDISEYDRFEDIYKDNLAEEKDFNRTGIQHHGMVREYDVIRQLPICVSLLNSMSDNRRDKAERALQTFMIAEEIGRTANPQTKSTVRASLYLSAINQLADNPELCDHKIDECPTCGKKNIQHQITSHATKIEELMRELFTGDNLERGVKLIKDSYHQVRSPFLHDGKLSGGENEGGWIGDSKAHIQFEENLVNYMNTCRRLIQLYMQKYAK